MLSLIIIVFRFILKEALNNHYSSRIHISITRWNGFSRANFNHRTGHYYTYVAAFWLTIFVYDYPSAIRVRSTSIHRFSNRSTLNPLLLLEKLPSDVRISSGCVPYDASAGFNESFIYCPNTI